LFIFQVGQVFNFGNSKPSVPAFTFPLDMKLVINMVLGSVQFWGNGKLLTEQMGLTGAVYPTLILMGRGVLHATIVKAIKPST
jgi:hypothetical protein